MLKSCLLSLYTLKTIQKHTQKSMFLRYPRGKCCPTTLRCCCLKPCSLPVRKLCSLEDSSSGKHDKKSCPPSEVNIIRKMTLTQFNLHYRWSYFCCFSFFVAFPFFSFFSFSSFTLGSGVTSSLLSSMFTASNLKSFLLMYFKSYPSVDFAFSV